MVATNGGAIGMMRFLNGLKVIVDHPAMHLLVGLVLIATGVVDMCGDVLDESKRFKVGAHHGIVILGIAQALSALPDFVHGIERWLRAAEIAQAKKRETEKQ
jgi:hypothetical protein